MILVCILVPTTPMNLQGARGKAGPVSMGSILPPSHDASSTQILLITYQACEDPTDSPQEYPLTNNRGYEIPLIYGIFTTTLNALLPHFGAYVLSWELWICASQLYSGEKPGGVTYQDWTNTPIYFEPSLKSSSVTKLALFSVKNLFYIN